MGSSLSASLDCTVHKWIESDWIRETEEHLNVHERLKSFQPFNLILFTASRYPISESRIIPRIHLSTKNSNSVWIEVVVPPPLGSLPECWLLISMMAHSKDVNVSVLNEQVGTALCQLKRKPFVLRRPICLVNETVVQTRTARPYGKDAAAALVLLRWEER